MKNLKIKFGLFSLLAILAVSVFLTSCEQEILMDEINTEQEIVESNEIFELTLPDGMSEEQAEEWLNNLTYDDVKNIGEMTDENQIESRYCNPWSSPVRYHTSVSCYGCANPSAKHTYYYYRYRYCSTYNYDTNTYITRVHYSYYSTYTCKTYC